MLVWWAGLHGIPYQLILEKISYNILENVFYFIFSVNFFLVYGLLTRVQVYISGAHTG